MAPAVTREQLHEAVWAQPMTAVAKRHLVSSSFLARVCERLNVPRPARGHWAKAKFGMAPPRPELPPAQPGDPLDWPRGGMPPHRAPRPVPLAPERAAVDVTPPPSPRHRGLHRLLAGAEAAFQHARVSDRYYDGGPYLRPYKKNLVDIFVSKDELGRALHLASALFHALEHRGHRVALIPCDYCGGYVRKHLDHREKPRKNAYDTLKTWSPSAATVAFVGTVAFGLTVYEVNHDVEGRYVGSEWVPMRRSSTGGERGGPTAGIWTSTRSLPSGRLAIRVCSPYHRVDWQRLWVEDSPGGLRSLLEEVGPTLEESAAEIAGRVAAAESQAEEERQRLEVERREQERRRVEEQRREAVKQSREQLLSIIESWGLAVRVETFFTDARQRAAASPDAGELLERLHEARRLLGDVDPLRYFEAWRTPAERLPGRDA